MLSMDLSSIGVKIISSLCSRVRYLSDLLENITFKDVEERISLCLLKLIEETETDKSIVNLSVTHQELGSMTGTVREVISRIMTRLKKKVLLLKALLKASGSIRLNC